MDVVGRGQRGQMLRAVAVAVSWGNHQGPAMSNQHDHRQDDLSQFARHTCDRRAFLKASLIPAVGLGLSAGFPSGSAAAQLRHAQGEAFGPTPGFSIIPVVGDGKWIWTDPPPDERGYLEPRSFSLRLGLELEGTGSATQIKATTTAPVDHPEQRIDDLEIKTQGCQAEVAPIGDQVAIFGLVAPSIEQGQKVLAYADYKLTLFKRYDGFTPGQFPAEQPDVPREIAKQYLGISPGIETRDRAVKQLSAELAAKAAHPWERAQLFSQWVWDNIEAKMGAYTSVKTALEKHVGDCEERSAVFVALARAAGIPARLVWVPNHNWTEFYLTDNNGQGQWIPAHTAAYSWFGWTGAHEVVLQKGDRYELPYRRGTFRLIPDWASWSGSKPKIRWTAELRPLPPEGSDEAGPGARSKDETGEWKLVGEHPLNRYMRR